MSFDIAAWNALVSSGAAASGASALVSAGATAATSLAQPKPPALPKPEAPPAAPVKVGQTAAAERARLASRLRGGGLAKLVLSGGSTGETSVSRTTLLGA